MKDSYFTDLRDGETYRTVKIGFGSLKTCDINAKVRKRMPAAWGICA